MANEISYERFSQHQGETFVISREDIGQVETVLIQVDDLRREGDQRPLEIRSDSFSMLFKAPRDKMLGQGMYLVTHKEMESHNLFLVPIEPDAESCYYESIIN